MPIPTRKQWLALKKKYGVPDGAVKGVDVGEALDKYWAKAKTHPSPQLDEALAASLKAYIAKIDKAKVKQFGPFKYEFDHNFLQPVVESASLIDRQTRLYLRQVFTGIQALNNHTEGGTTYLEHPKIVYQHFLQIQSKVAAFHFDEKKSLPKEVAPAFTALMARFSELTRRLSDEEGHRLASIAWAPKMRSAPATLTDQRDLAAVKAVIDAADDFARALKMHGIDLK